MRDLRLRVPHHEHALDKPIAATAIINDLTVVTRNAKDYQKSGVYISLAPSADFFVWNASAD